MIKSERQCGTCTKCCQGHLVLDIFGKRWSGRPCQFVGDNGCTIYEDRPKNPCKVFKCEWLKDTDYVFPEWLQPNKSGFMLMWKKNKEIPYLLAVKCGEIDEKSLLWLMTFVNENNINLEILTPGKKHRIGSKQYRNYYKK